MAPLKNIAVLVLIGLLAAACGEGDPVASTITPTSAATVAPEPTDDPTDDLTDDPADDPADDIEGEDIEEGIDVDGVDRESVADLFVTAIIDGDYDLAAEIADPPALDFFEPWEPISEASLQQVDGNDSFFIFLGPGYLVQCAFDADGYVADCAEEGEPEYEEDPVVEDEIAPEHGGDEQALDEEFGDEYIYDNPSNYTYLEYLFPEEGGVPEVRDGGIVRGTEDAYVVEYVGCCKGDTLYVSISSLEDNAVFYIYAPDGTLIADETTDAAPVIDQDGEYWITVGATRGNAEYTIEVGVAVDAS